MSGMTMAPMRATAQPATVTAPNLTQAVNAAIANANQRIMAAIPSIGANPLQRLMDKVSNPMFVEIIRIANQNTRKPVRTVGGVAVTMEPVQAVDASMPPEMQSTLLKLRTLAAWMTLARFAPVTLTRATAQWLLTHNRWNEQKYASLVSHLFINVGTAVAKVGADAKQAAADLARATANAAKDTYVKAISEWHASQPWTTGTEAHHASGPGSARITSGWQYDAWMALKPQPPPGINALAGGIFGGESSLRGLSGKSLKRAYRALHGLGEDAPQEMDMGGGGEGGGDETGGAAGSGGDGYVPDPNPQPNPAGDAGTGSVNNDSQGNAGITIPPGIMQLLTQLLMIGGTTFAKGAADLITGGNVQYTYGPDGRSTPPGRDLPMPLPRGMEYAPDGSTRPVTSDGGLFGVPLWVWGLGLVGAVAVSKKR